MVGAVDSVVNVPFRGFFVWVDLLFNLAFLLAFHYPPAPRFVLIAFVSCLSLGGRPGHTFFAIVPPTMFFESVAHCW